jgi:F-type H+-transporting ATPase subunit epsilon
MAHTKFQVEVLTPEGEVFNDEVEMVSTRTTTGSIGILANHTPLLAMLDPTELRLYVTESEVVRFAQAEGYMQVANNRALILVEEAHEPDSLDVSELRERLQRAEQELESAGDDSEKQRVAERDKLRLERFVDIAGG